MYIKHCIGETGKRFLKTSSDMILSWYLNKEKFWNLYASAIVGCYISHLYPISAFEDPTLICCLFTDKTLVL